MYETVPLGEHIYPHERTPYYHVKDYPFLTLVGVVKPTCTKNGFSGTETGLLDIFLLHSGVCRAFRVGARLSFVVVRTSALCLEPAFSNWDVLLAAEMVR